MGAIALLQLEASCFAGIITSMISCRNRCPHAHQNTILMSQFHLVERGESEQLSGLLLIVHPRALLTPIAGRSLNPQNLRISELAASLARYLVPVRPGRTSCQLSQVASFSCRQDRSWHSTTSAGRVVVIAVCVWRAWSLRTGLALMSWGHYCCRWSFERRSSCSYVYS